MQTLLAQLAAQAALLEPAKRARHVKHVCPSAGQASTRTVAVDPDGATLERIGNTERLQVTSQLHNVSAM